VTGNEARAQVEAHTIEQGDALLARIDAHLERGIADTSPAHLARGEALQTRLEEHLARMVERDAYDSWRFEMRLDSLRGQRALGEVSQTLARRSSAFVRYFVDESPAHRVALWVILHDIAREDALHRRPQPSTSCRVEEFRRLRLDRTVARDSRRRPSPRELPDP